MSVSILRNFLCWTMILVLPVSLTAADAKAAILHHQGGVWVNGSDALDSSAIFNGDVLQTRASSIAKLDVQGSTVVIQPESVVQFEDNSLTLEHGSVSVDTSLGMKVRVKCITVVPASTEWTQYDVTDTNGTVQVSARKKDVNIDHASPNAKPSKENSSFNSSNSGNVREGQQASREESEACGMARTPGETQGAFSSPYTKWIALGAAGGLILPWVFPKGGSGGGPAVSPSQP